MNFRGESVLSRTGPAAVSSRPGCFSDSGLGFSWPPQGASEALWPIKLGSWDHAGLARECRMARHFSEVQSQAPYAPSQSVPRFYLPGVPPGLRGPKRSGPTPSLGQPPIAAAAWGPIQQCRNCGPAAHRTRWQCTATLHTLNCRPAACPVRPSAGGGCREVALDF
jgi:hypothetical protein